MASRNPVKDKIAIVGIGSTGFMRDADGRSGYQLAFEACKSAILDSGLGRDEIDGVCASSVWDNIPDRTTVDIRPRAHEIVSALGLEKIKHFSNVSPIIGFHLNDAIGAIYSGQCETVLLSHTVFRAPQHSKQARQDPFRRSLVTGASGARLDLENISGPIGYTIWANFYMHHWPVTKEHLGLIAINGRTNAAGNPGAVYRSPLSMEEYLSAPMVRDPLVKFDMDVPVDGSDAFVVTSVERARELTDHPVVVHATAEGMVPVNEEDQLPSLEHHGQHVAVEEFRRKSDIDLEDADVVMLYDGFTNIALAWIESFGWCEPGEAGYFVRDNWSSQEQRILIGGKVPVNTHGGSLSEGGTQGSGHLREAVAQLKGTAGERQVAGAENIILGLGGFFFNSHCISLRRL